jgi:RNA polymerase sigma-70 factor (ECF subfamily)
MSSPRSHERLVNAAKGGDEQAFRILTDPLVGELRGHCTRILGNSHDAEDALQETLVKAWSNLGTLRGSEALRGWLYSIATNTSLNLVKARRRHPVAPLGGERHESAPAADDAYEQRAQVELLFLAVIQRLPARQRAVVILRDGLGWSPPEIAELLGESTSAVNSALQRARASLASLLQADGDIDDLDDLQRALLSGYVAAWDGTDVDGLASLARADAIRTALIERLRPLGGGWVHIPPSPADQGELSFRPAFMHGSR